MKPFKVVLPNLPLGVIASYNFEDLGFGSPYPISFTLVPKCRTMSKLYKLQELVKTCDFLTLKINNKPLLFIRYV